MKIHMCKVTSVLFVRVTPLAYFKIVYANEINCRFSEDERISHKNWQMRETYAPWLFNSGEHCTYLIDKYDFVIYVIVESTHAFIMIKKNTQNAEVYGPCL